MARKLEVEIVGDASSLHRALGKADSSAGGFGKTLGKMGKVAALSAGGAGLGALAVGLKIGIDEYSQSQKVAAQTNAVIKSTGGVANVTAEHVSNLATSIMKKTGIDDEQIASSENMLLTFKNVRNELGKGNDVFDQATGLVTDMSVAFGIDGSKAAIQLGKALNDPIKGISALSRIGVTFTKGQKDQIKALVDSGQTMKAQKIILAELKSEVGGSAEAMGKTLPGQINIARESFNNFAGDLVAKMIPVLERTIGWLRDHWPEIKTQILGFWASVKPALQNFGAIIEEVAGLIRKHWGSIEPFVTNFANTIKKAMEIIGDALKIVSAILRGDWSAAWKGVKQLVGDVMDFIKLRVQSSLLIIKAAFTIAGKAIKAALLTPLQGLGAAVWNLVNNIGAVISNKVGAILSWGKTVGNNIVTGIIGAVTGIGGKVWNIINNIGSVITQKATAIAGWGKDVGKGMISGIVDGLSGLGGKIVGLIKAAVNAVIRKINAAITFDITIPIPFHKDVHIGQHKTIPELASGGIVTSPTLAMIGERGPEAVIPLGPGGRDLNATIVVQVDGETLWKATQKYALRDLMRNGTTGLAG